MFGAVGSPKRQQVVVDIRERSAAPYRDQPRIRNLAQDQRASLSLRALSASDANGIFTSPGSKGDKAAAGARPENRLTAVTNSERHPSASLSGGRSPRAAGTPGARP